MSINVGYRRGGRAICRTVVPNVVLNRFLAVVCVKSPESLGATGRFVTLAHYGSRNRVYERLRSKGMGE
jgi:hypothetical protein